MERHQLRVVYDIAFEPRKWMNRIPHIKFPADWEVQIIPPFSGAIARFRVNNKVSVYLDGYDILGFVGEPYWEVYPHKDDVYRCAMNNVDDLIVAIQESLDEPTT
jgi:hypothetical protein